MKRTACFLLLLFVFAAVFAVPRTSAAEPEAPPTASQVEAPQDGHGILHRVLLYIPNRLLDIFDLVRLRLRVGPGVAVGVRATEAADVFLGSYVSMYIGLPGPRQHPGIPLPLGPESYNGAEVSIADATTGIGVGPNYSTTEFGLGLQAALIGVDVGADPMELVDLAAGFLLLDPRQDDF